VHRGALRRSYGPASAPAQERWYNPRALRMRLALLSLLVFSIAGCAYLESAQKTATPALLPYHTPSPSPSPPPLIVPTLPSPTPAPTATPFTYVVQKDDTLIGIAYRHGVTLDELMLANPGVDPGFLSIGQVLIIPLPSAEGESAPSLATPVPLQLTEVACYRTPTDGLWCITSAVNDTLLPVENLQVAITLIDAVGEPLASHSAYGPLNMLDAGQSLPLAVFFPPPAPAFSAVAAQLLSAIELGDADARYLSLETTYQGQSEDAFGRLWRVQGQVSPLPEEERRAERVVVLVVGYDAQRNVAGFAIWEAGQELDAEHSITFDVMLFSLGPPIVEVNVMPEALAQP
jgi:uncharacterized protein YuzE